MTDQQAAPAVDSSEAELRQQMRALQQQLNQAQRLTALGELVSTTAHEFNNVLMSIINYAKLGLRQRDDATRDRALKKVLEASERATKITSSILGMARNRADRFEPVDLGSLIQDTMVLLEREMRKYRIHVTQELAETPPTLANGNQIQQVLLNVLINARQAMPDGGEILIRVRHDAESRMNELTIRDTGCGIPADQLRNIFQPFFTTKSGPDSSGLGGTGLGLAACRNIIESHRGRVRVESTVGKGTAFIIKLRTAEVTRLPVTDSPAPARAASQSHA